MARSCAKDPLEKFRFGITWSLETVTVEVAGQEQTLSSPVPKAGFHDVQMPKRTTNKIMYREGNDPDVSSASAGLSSMEDIVCNRGLMPSSSYQEIGDWVKAVHSPSDTTLTLDHSASDKVRRGSGAENYRKDVWIWMYDRMGSVVRVWKLYNAFPVNYAPGSDLNSSEDGDKSMESLTLAYEDFIEIKPGEGGTFPLGEDPAVNAAVTG